MKFESSRCALWALLLLGITAGAGAQTPPDEGRYPSTGPISGYMDFHFNKLDAGEAVLDFHRFVLIVNHSFSPRIRFVAELELEHAFVEGLEASGELELEQAYVDFLLTRGFNVRAGLLLVPMGIINERHEPPVYHGVERPFVDTVIVPTTWFENGAGIHGEVGRGLRYRAYVMAPLNALEFTAEEGIREGRQGGSESNINRPAIAARVEYVGVPHVTFGVSAWSGESHFLAPRLSSRVHVGEADVRYTRDRLELRGQFAQVAIGNADRLNQLAGGIVGISPNIARALRGFYGEAAWRAWAAGPAKDLVTFLRYENFDTQHRMPEGYLPLKEFDRDAWILGATYYPDPDVAVKIDYTWQRSQSSVIKAPNSFNVGLGWWF
jgi:hypothetical protein